MRHGEFIQRDHMRPGIYIVDIGGGVSFKMADQSGGGDRVENIEKVLAYPSSQRDPNVDFPSRCCALLNVTL